MKMLTDEQTTGAGAIGSVYYLLTNEASALVR